MFKGLGFKDLHYLHRFLRGFSLFFLKRVLGIAGS